MERTGCTDAAGASFVGAEQPLVVGPSCQAAVAGSSSPFAGVVAVAAVDRGCTFGPGPAWAAFAVVAFVDAVAAFVAVVERQQPSVCGPFQGTRREENG